ncbi:MAG TPA: tetratricopeptide repeat protein [Candidatus Udaeobacter sp.]|nr:tetratricopeptide repeat protein [Candidatus Udaeobacter sp.]
MQRPMLLRIVTVAFAVILVTACSKEAKKTRLVRDADTYFKAGNYDKAKVSYLNLLRLDPQNALAFERIGAMWQDDGVPLRAAPFLKKASELDPKNIENRIRLARCCIAVGAFNEAKKEAIEALQQEPANGDAIMILAEAAHTKEDLEDAAQRIEKFPNRNGVAFHLASASAFLRKGNAMAATISVRQALQIDAKSSAAHMAMGDLHLFQKDTKKAAEEYKEAADLAPIRSTERLKYAAFKSAIGDAQETRRVAGEMTKQVPDYLPGWVLLAELALKDKKYDEALSHLENVFGRDPEYVDGRKLQSEILMAKGQTKKAVEVLERLDRAHPAIPIIKFHLARAYFKNNNVNQAKLTLEQTVSSNPNYVDAVLMLAEINIRTGHSDLAIEPLQRILHTYPAQTRPAMLLATAYGILDRPDDAAAVLQEQAQLSPNDPNPYAALGLTYRRAKRYDEARQQFERAKQLDPNNVAVFTQLVELDLQQKHFDAARQRIRSQFQGKTDSADAHFWEARVLASEGKWDGVENELRQTIKSNPNVPGTYELLVQAYIATNKLPQAVKELEELLAKEPNNSQALMTLGLIYERTKDYPKERDVYEKLLAIDPNFVPALNNLAYLYAERFNDLDKAYDLARKAHDLQPQETSAGDTFGWVLYKRGEYQQALPILQESAQTSDNPEIQFHLGMTAYMMGQTELAKTALRKAVDSAKDFEGREEAKGRLISLETGKSESPRLSIAQLEATTKQQPNDPVLQIRLGEAYEKQGAFDKAAVAFEEALKLNPKLPVPPTKLAELYAGPLQNSERALVYAKKARELVPNDPRITTLLGKVAYQVSNFAWSYSLLQEAARQRGDDPAVLDSLAWSAYAMGKVNEARDLMQKVAAAGGNASEAADAKKFLMFTEDPKQPGGEGEVQKELTSNPGYVPALMVQAALYAQQGRTQQAIETDTKVLQRFPDFAPAQKHLAILYAQDPSKVTAAYENAIKARKTLPDDPELAELLGRLSYEKKEYPRAVQLLREAGRTKTLDANSLFYLGMSELRARQSTEARVVLDKALTSGLQEPFATEAKQALENLSRE